MAFPRRAALLTDTTFYALSVLFIFAINPSAAEPTTIALLRPHPISRITPLTQIRYCPPHERAACRRNLRDCKRINAPGCLQGYRECIEECHAGD
jgi:hypothetical protein